MGPPGRAGQSGDEGLGLPAAKRRAAIEPFSTQAPAALPGHVGLDGGLITKDQPFRTVAHDWLAAFCPVMACPQHACALPPGGDQAFFIGQTRCLQRAVDRGKMDRGKMNRDAMGSRQRTRRVLQGDVGFRADDPGRKPDVRGPLASRARCPTLKFGGQAARRVLAVHQANDRARTNSESPPRSPPRMPGCNLARDTSTKIKP